MSILLDCLIYVLCVLICFYMLTLKNKIDKLNDEIALLKAKVKFLQYIRGGK